jgi:hypothetical protein
MHLTPASSGPSSQPGEFHLICVPQLGLCVAIKGSRWQSEEFKLRVADIKEFISIQYKSRQIFREQRHS